ncbi:peptide chain release factor H [Martelella mangrovi]|uniref:Peptide chain release factor n=1 Tax=Martelella mangrovi TaxID=1397477 RepID=A0ABV2I6C3_9HYPH
MSVPETVRLLVTSGDGPQECRRAVSLVLNRLEQEAADRAIRFDAEIPDAANTGKDPSSCLVTLAGKGGAELARRWLGTVQWTCQSPFRPQHKRRNWFVGVFAVEVTDAQDAEPKTEDLKVETFRSGGPGGQHQNTTDSGVRITHLPTGVSALSTDERSQHRNRQAAYERLVAKLILRQQEAQSRNRSAQNQLHRQLERGNPARVFKGKHFNEVR